MQIKQAKKIHPIRKISIYTVPSKHGYIGLETFIPQRQQSFPPAAGGEQREGGTVRFMSQAETYVLEMKDVVKLFPGVRALDGVSLRVRPGSVHVIVGENGAGKSTLMKIISGEYVADEGEMIYKGAPVGKRTILETINMGISRLPKN